MLALPESILRQVLEIGYQKTKSLEALVKFNIKTLPEQVSVFEALKLEKARAIEAYKS